MQRLLQEDVELVELGADDFLRCPADDHDIDLPMTGWPRSSLPRAPPVMFGI